MNPKIRFKQPNGSEYPDWEQRKVSNVAEIIAGGTPSTKERCYWEPKEIPWLSSGEVHKKYITFTDDMISKEGMNNSSAKIVKENSVLIALAGQGKTRGTVAINRIPLTTNQSIAAMTFNDDIIPEFVFCNLENRYKEIRRMSSGDGSRGGLNKQLVGDIEIPYTSKPEQEKIGAYFTKLDNIIAIHQRKLDSYKQAKKTMMQKIFSQEVRFKKEDGSDFPDWKEKRLGELVTEYIEKTTVNNQYTVLSSTHNGIKFQNEYFNKSTASLNTTGYKIVPKGYFTYRAMSDNDIFVFNRQMIIEKGIVSPAYPVFDVTGADKNFFEQFINNTDEIKKQLIVSKEGGTRYALSFSKFCNMEVTIPMDKAEQQLIADFLTSYDELITAAENELNAYKMLKKCMLQKMFV